MNLNNKILPLINKILANNQGSLKLLQRYSNNSFTISLLGLINFSATIAENGFLNTLDEIDNITTHIKINPEIARSLVNNNKIEMLKYITISEDKQFGVELLKILSNLQIIEALTYTESLPLSIIIDILRKSLAIIKNNISLITQNIAQSVTEYLQYETTDIVNKYEIEQYCNQVDDLREKADIITKRINLLSNRQK
ncbi:MAG: hypothetical protein ACK5Z5_05795 [Neisseriaceae bacterium]